jgi:RNA recognition motif-containing protein
MRPDYAQKAKEALHNGEFHGRTLQINYYEIKEVRKIQNEENQDKNDFAIFRAQHGGIAAIPGSQKPEVLLEMLKKLFQQMQPNQQRPNPRAGSYPQGMMGGARQPMGGNKQGYAR